ncbi:hypothetical protein KKA14_14945 [bacterium]|nr:hypothetical protein [bacterium]
MSIAHNQDKIQYRITMKKASILIVEAGKTGTLWSLSLFLEENKASFGIRISLNHFNMEKGIEVNLHPGKLIDMTIRIRSHVP